MNRRFRLVLVILAGISAGGCANSAYLQDRKCDALDIFTGTVGLGVGARARVGIFKAGFFFNQDLAGHRLGTSFSRKFNSRPHPSMHPSMQELTWMIPAGLFSGVDFCYPTKEPMITWGNHGFRPNGYEAMDFAFLTVPFGCYTKAWAGQIEVAAGAGPTVRAGFNVAELVDFLIGWTGLDILGDDLRLSAQDLTALRQKQKSVGKLPGSFEGSVLRFSPNKRFVVVTGPDHSKILTLLDLKSYSRITIREDALFRGPGESYYDPFCFERWSKDSSEAGVSIWRAKGQSFGANHRVFDDFYSINAETGTVSKIKREWRK